MGDSVLITRLSSASWFKICYKDSVIHLDPGFFEERSAIIQKLDKKANLILISHPHHDHIKEEILAEIADDKTEIITVKDAITSKVDKLHLVKADDEIYAVDIKIKAIPAYNTPAGHSTRKYHPLGFGVGYVLSIGDKRIYFAGDTDLIKEMENLGDIDIAFLPIGGTYVMDFGEALEAVKTIKPRIVIPMHEFKQSLCEFKKSVERETSSLAFVINPGESISIK